MPRLVTANLFMTLDGAVENPHLWQGNAFDDVLGGVMQRTLGEARDVVLGRKTYEMWAGHWSREDVQDPFKDFINPIPKHIASTTLEAPLAWENSTLLEGGLLDGVRALKERGEGTISVQGSLSVVAQLLAAGLLDRLTAIVHPVLAGRGERRLMDSLELDGPLPLRLLEQEATTTGTAILVYGPEHPAA